MKFEKMHGLGNDFCVTEEGDSSVACKICNRHTGVGADGLIVVKKNPLEMVFYNADGSKASMCGNGIRCFAKYVYEHQMVFDRQFKVLTLAGMIHIRITSLDPFLCQVGMGKPFFNNQMLHISDDLSSFGRIVKIDRFSLTLYSLFIGTIHTVIFVESLDSEVLKYARQIEQMPLFRNGTNVDFVHVLNSTELEIKTYERGVGWTLACGTGACAAFVAARKLALIEDRAKVHLSLGDLDVFCENEEIYLIGPAMTICKGEWEDSKC